MTFDKVTKKKHLYLLTFRFSTLMSDHVSTVTSSERGLTGVTILLIMLL